MIRSLALVKALVLAALIAPGACEARQPEAPPATSTSSSPAASPEDIAFAKRLSNAFKSVASHAEPSVVNITQMNRVTYRQSIFDMGTSKVVPTGLGSGFIVSRDGFIVTNDHVVRGAEQLKVKLTDGTEYDAKVVGRDEATDLAVIKIDAHTIKHPLEPLKFGDSDALDVGEWVLAIGSPFGLSSTVTAGIVSAKGRTISPNEAGRVFEDFIQTDAAINPGNSGGPLLNLQGEVVGINSAIASKSGGYEGIGFAIPANVAKAVMDNIIANGRVVRGWLGVELAEATPNELSADRFSGAEVKHVVENSPAAQAGLREGDIITKFQGRAMNETRLRAAIALTPPGTAVPLEVLRAGKPTDLQVKLGDQSAALGDMHVPELGMTVRTITKELAAAAGVPRLRGVVITDLDPNGRAQNNGAKVGDVIVAVESGDRKQTITTGEQLANAAAKADYGRGIRLDAIRENMQGYLDIKD